MSSLRHSRTIGTKPDEYTIQGRCMLSNTEEFSCVARRFSNTHIAIAVDATGVMVGDRVVCYLDQIGLIQGTVIRLCSLGFILEIRANRARQIYLSASIEWHSSRAREWAEQRSSPRIVPVERVVKVWLAEGLAVPGVILNVSISGAAIAMRLKQRPFVNAVIKVGRHEATVIRHLENGVGIQFSKWFPIEQFGRDIIL